MEDPHHAFEASIRQQLVNERENQDIVGRYNEAVMRGTENWAKGNHSLSLFDAITSELKVSGFLDRFTPEGATQ